MTEQPYASEDVLQALLAQHPEDDEAGDRSKREHLARYRAVGIPSESSSSSRKLRRSTA
jgi:hypothetical protein